MADLFSSWVTPPSGSSPSGYRTRMRVEPTVLDVAGLKATFAWTWTIHANPSGYNFRGYNRGQVASIDGTEVRNVTSQNPPTTAPQPWPSGQFTIASGTIEISYDADGTKTVEVVANYTGNAAGWNPGNINLSGSIELPPLPVVPTSLTVTRVSDGQQNLAWSNPGGPWTKVTVQRRTDNGAWQQIAQPSGNATSFSDTTTVADRKYDYRVAGVIGSAQSAFTGAVTVYTTPAVPTGVSAVREDADIRVSASMPTWATHFNVQDDGEGVGGNITVASLPWLHESPNPALTHRYRVRARRASGGVGSVTLISEWSAYSNTVQLISPPNAPTNLAPNGQVRASDVDVRFSWVHNPVDSSPQTAYELRHRVPEGSWTTLSGTTAAFRDVSLTAGPVEWQARTKGSHADWSPWSSTATVEVIDRPGVAVTQPDGVWAASTLTVGWSWFQTQDFPQSAWEAHLINDAAEVVEQRSGSGATAQTTFSHRLVEGDWTVQVRAASGGIWSAWGTEPFTVTFDLPATPTGSGQWIETMGGVELTFQAGDGGDAETVRVVIDRSVDGEKWEPAFETTDTMATLLDAESLSYGETLYRVTAFTEEGATAELLIPVVATSGAIWLSGGPGYSATARLPFDPVINIRAGRQRTLKQWAGRALPVVYAGEGLSRVVSVSGRTTDHALSGEETANVEALTVVAQLPEPVHLYRDPDGRRIYGALSVIAMPRESAQGDPDGWNGLWGYSFTLTETSR